MQPWLLMIGCRVVNSICEPGGIVGPLFLSLFLGEGSRPSESVGHSHFLPAPARPPFHTALVGASFFLNFLILLLHLLLLQLPWQMQTYGYICGRHGLFGPIQNLCDRIPRSR
ncbi:uncharacterized protein CLUP02_08677 [Colletotrichum lupini]|uniref:Uncharacterized protein n=1 Tax=Colletotrichum lupini TaxID=145971 RepID=A0A9Q8WGV1_9PEZI|nr:uncharacterized protein CLUP02_08677 [Colletotrichum lupini]UQC83183.1 hypothetical protein CLUP02_08677 [Colletotrichum lupini]